MGMQHTFIVCFIENLLPESGALLFLTDAARRERNINFCDN